MVKMRESQSQIVAAAEDKLFNVRTRTLESHTPNPDASKINNEEEVTADVDVQSPTVLGKGNISK